MAKEFKTKEITVTDDSGAEVNLIVKSPSAVDIEAADSMYASKVATLIRKNGERRLLLRSEVEKYLRENGIWTEVDDEKIQTLKREISRDLNKIRSGNEKLSIGRQLSISVLNKRSEIVNLTAKRRIVEDATVESIAEIDRIDYLIFLCTVRKENGVKYWETFQDLKESKLGLDYSKAYSAFYELQYGVNNEFEKRLPEIKWLTKYGFVNGNLQYTDRKTGKLVDVFGKEIVKSDTEEMIENLMDLQGDLVEKSPFIDDETGEPVIPEESLKETITV